MLATLHTFLGVPPQERKHYGIGSKLSPVYRLRTLDSNLDLALDYLHNWSLGVIKRLVAMGFELMSPVDKGFIKNYMDTFNWTMSGFSKKHSGSRLIKYMVTSEC